MKKLPIKFIDRLREIIPESGYALVLKTFESDRPLTVRVNMIKTDLASISSILKAGQVRFKSFTWCQNALILEDCKKDNLTLRGLTDEGLLYHQSPSSMLVPVLLDPHPNEKILDLCSAPGSKASQMAAMMNNQGQLDCVEHVKTRFYKLKSVLSLLGVENAKLTVYDGRCFRSNNDLYDRILVDAPCSSEGRFHTGRPKSTLYWSLRKIKEMVKKQRGLLLNAGRLLKKGGTLIYSTCTFAPEENEGVVDWFLRKTEEQFQIMPVNVDGIKICPSLTQWRERAYDNQVRHCLRILPDGVMDGFFVAKLIKV